MILAHVETTAVLVASIPSTIAAIASIVAARVGSSNKQHLVEINHAVNGTEAGTPTIRENVEAIAGAVNGTTGAPTMQENVTELAGRRDLDPDKPPS